MQLIQSDIELMYGFEGLSLKPFLDSAKVPTIGRGTTIYPNGIKVTLQDKPITELQADTYFSHDLDNVQAWLHTNLMGQVTQHQYGAMCSFFYNIGYKGFYARYPHTGLAFQTCNWKEFSKLMMDFVHAGGHFCQGLYDRRVAEVAYFNTPD